MQQQGQLHKIRLREKLGATRRDPILPLKKYQQAVGNLCVQDAEREPVGRPATGQHIVLNVAFPRATIAWYGIPGCIRTPASFASDATKEDT